MRANPRMILFVVATVVAGGLFATSARGVGWAKGTETLPEIDVAILGNFDLDQETGTIEDVPAQWRALDGKRVCLVGEMWFGNCDRQDPGRFELVRLPHGQKFVPLKQNFVLCVSRSGTRVQARSGIVRVSGVLHVNVEHAEGRVSRVFTLDAERLDREDARVIESSNGPTP